MKPKLFYKLFALIIATGSSATVFSQMTTAVDDYMLDKMNGKYDIPGLGFSLIKNGKIALAKGYGYANIEKDIPLTPYTVLSEIASVSKTVTATAVMKLWEQGLFQLDDPINNYLPFQVKNPYYPNTPITFRMLLIHTSSIHSDDFDPISTNFVYVRPPGTGMSLENFIQSRLVPGGSLYDFQTTSFYNVPPGLQSRYSNTGYGLLGYLVEKISGMPFDQYCKQKIFQPLCMNQTAWFYSAVDTNSIARPYARLYSGNLQALGRAQAPLYELLDYPCGQLKTTVIDFSKYMQMHLNFGILNGVRIIDSTTEVMMRTPQINVITNGVVMHDGVPITINVDDCLGFTKVTHISEGNKVFFGHDGGDIGVSTEFWLNISNNTAEFIFANVLEQDQKFQPVPAVLDIHLFLEQSVADTISTSGLPNLDCLFNPCEHNANYWTINQSKWTRNSIPMRIGTKHYYSKNQILDLLSSPDNNDASIVLAKALIVAKFNVAQGSELSPVVLTINSAMNLIGEHKLPYDIPVSFLSAIGAQMLALAATLDSYNAGTLNTTSCSGAVASIAQANLSKQAGSKPTSPALSVFPNPSLSVYPNPATLSTTISFYLPQQEKVSFKIFDMKGRVISTITERNFPAGSHLLKWNAVNTGNGVYVVKMQAGNKTETQWLDIVK